MTVFSMDPRRYSQKQTLPQVINLVDYNVINLVDFEEKINWLPPRKMIQNKVRFDETSTIASQSTMEKISRSKVERPVCDAIMCTAETMLTQSRDEVLLLTDGTEHLHFVEDREEPQVDFDCNNSKEVWLGYLMDAAGEAAEFLTEGIVGASNSGHRRATSHLLQLKEDREKKKCLNAPTNEVPRDIPEIVDVCELQDQEEQQQQQQDDMLMMLPMKKQDPPASKKECEEESFPLLEIHIPDVPDDELNNL